MESTVGVVPVVYESQSGDSRLYCTTAKRMLKMALITFITGRRERTHVCVERATGMTPVWGCVIRVLFLCPGVGLVEPRTCVCVCVF